MWTGPKSVALVSGVLEINPVALLSQSFSTRWLASACARASMARVGFGTGAFKAINRALA